MYIAMNRFKIERGKEGVFENLWLSRDSHLKKVSGFVSFNLLKGTTEENFALYASHSMWNSQTDFSTWTKSEAFQAAHKNAGSHSDIYLGHPVFEGFEVII